MTFEDELEIYHLAKRIESCDKVEAEAERQKRLYLKTLSIGTRYSTQRMVDSTTTETRFTLTPEHYSTIMCDL